MKNLKNKKKIENSKNKKGILKLFTTEIATKTCIIFGMAAFLTFVGLAITDSIVADYKLKVKENPTVQYQALDEQLFDNLNKGFMGSFISSATAVVTSGAAAAAFSVKENKKKSKDNKEIKEKQVIGIER